MRYLTLNEVLDLLIRPNHATNIDGNKRTGHAAIEVFLLLNGLEINAETAEQEQIVLRLAAGELERADFTAWLQKHVQSVSSDV